MMWLNQSCSRRRFRKRRNAPDQEGMDEQATLARHAVFTRCVSKTCECGFQALKTVDLDFRQR